MTFAKRLSSALGLLCLLGWALPAEARPFRPDQIPNGNVFSCDTCHNDDLTRNAFGSLVEANLTAAGAFRGDGNGDGDTNDCNLGAGIRDDCGIDWNSTLAAANSDGDPFTNGQELGDTAGAFAPGNADPNFEVSNPGVNGSRLTCGSGTRAINEQCDDGDTSGGDGCSAACTTEAGFSCNGGDQFSPTICNTNCGDGLIRGSEQCDQGNGTNGDGCSSACTVESGFSCNGQPSSCNTVCGDGLTRGGEQCDDANGNNNDACKNNCTNNICGDGALRNGFETCDDGNNIAGDGCRADCAGTEQCRDGLFDPAAGEQCDDGNNTNNDFCSNICRNAACGDNIIQPVRGENCDDGNNIDGDGCRSPECTSEGCGDGVLDPQDQCDDGNLINTDACTNTCALATCHDGILRNDLAPGAPGFEQCDDGNFTDTDDCVNACANATCGDGHLRANSAEDCDDANLNNGDACLNTCEFATCGDGFLFNGVEDCDDANNVAGDGCRVDCAGTEICGDGLFDPATGEECDDQNNSNTDACLNTCEDATCGDSFTFAGVEDCDDANLSNGDACLNTCEDATCGDSFLFAGVETCDDANNVAGDGCRADCAGLEICGDSFFDPAAGEACDDANNTAGDGCRSDCLGLEICGDNLLDLAAGEICEDGGTAAGDGCRSDCLGVEDCGDGITDAAAGEQCDDANNDDGDGCDALCELEVCGDGILNNAGTEICDDGGTTTGDGCDDLCQVEAGHYFEEEINNSTGQANAVADEIIIHGGFLPATDLDVFRFELSATADVRLQTFDRTTPRATCADVDTILTLLDADGAPIDQNEDGGITPCSLLDPDAGAGSAHLPAGVYFARVSSASPLDDQAYQLQLTISALCGDGAQEGAETCDDGNFTDGDGCASTCDLEFDLAGRGGCAAAPEQEGTASWLGFLGLLALAFYMRRRVR